MTFERYAARRSQDFADLIADLEPGIARKGGLRMTSLGASDASTKDKRAVPLRRELVDALRELKPKGVLPTRPVFWYAWPTYDILCSDFKRPGIERVDGLGRVLHFHSFRKTWQAFGVRFGVNQRAAQEILGYSDLSSTANVYTDVPALSLHSEIAKLPWITEGGERLESVSHLMSQKGEKMPAEPSLPEILLQLREVLQSVRIQAKTNPAPLVEAGSESEKWLPRLGSNRFVLSKTGNRKSLLFS